MALVLIARPAATDNPLRGDRLRHISSFDAADESTSSGNTVLDEAVEAVHESFVGKLDGLSKCKPPNVLTLAGWWSRIDVI